MSKNHQVVEQAPDLKTLQEKAAAAKAAAKKAAEEAREAAKAAKAAKVKSKGINRVALAAVTLLRSDRMEVKEVITQADALYVKAGGKSNDRESAYAVKKALSVLEAIGAVQVNDGKVNVQNMVGVQA